MRTYTFLLIFIFLGFKSFSQRQDKVLDFIILLDGKALFGGMNNLEIIARRKNLQDKTINVEYHPGALSLSQADYEFLKSDSTTSVFMKFTYTDFCQIKRRDRRYEIDLNKGWLHHYYYVVNIYNTDHHRYKDIFYPLKGKTYTYEFNGPSGTPTVVRKKITKDCD